MTKEKLQELKDALDYVKYVNERYSEVGVEEKKFSSAKMLQLGIGYLDFDPVYF
jgi:hypothetical protein